MAENSIKIMNFNALNGDSLADKLRSENVDKFNTLVRMHLSFVLDLSTDENEAIIDKQKLKKWSFAPFSNKKSKLTRGIMDGLPLTQEGICQVYQLIEFLKQEPYICSEGIFRRTGSLMRQQELRSLLNQGVTVLLDGTTYSVHDCASVLKGFLAELPEPLLTDAHYQAHTQISELFSMYTKTSQEIRLLRALQLLLLLLPSENRILFKDVLNLLHRTASFECNNKMSAENLATIFTPHLLCPRNLTPEGLHFNSTMLSRILAFMIKKCSELFHVPPQLTVDIRAHYSDLERRKLLSPRTNFNESISDNYAASTVYSFTDVEQTAKENQSNPTEAALAQLYAYIQGLPDSSKKRKLIKQFNKKNGYGTPLPIVRTNITKNKSIGSSIKKHIFHKSIAKSITKNGGLKLRSSSEELLGETMMTPRSRKPVLVVSGTNINNLPKIETQDFNMDSVKEESQEVPLLMKSKSLGNLNIPDSSDEDSESLTDTFREYLHTRSVLNATATDLSFSSCTDDYYSTALNNSQLSSSLMHCLNGLTPPEQRENKFEGDNNEKELVLRPKQFDNNGKPIMYETSF